MQQIDSRLPKITDCLYRLSVKALIVEDKKLLLVYEQDDRWWSLPGGGVEYRETLDQALRRELAEELDIDPKSLEYEGRIAFVATGAIVKGIPKVSLFFRVQIPTEGIKATGHVIKHTWCSAESLSRLHLSPSISDVIEQVTSVIKESQA